MAIILERKPIESLPEIEDAGIGIGITLPLIRGGNGYFNQSFSTIDAVKTNIKNLLLTKQGERVMQPLFGTKLWNLLFENDTDADTQLETKIEKEIENSINTWLPFVKIVNVDINSDKKTNRELNSYNISIKFKTENFNTINSVTFNII